MDAEISQNKHDIKLIKKEKIIIGTAHVINNDIVFIEDRDISSLLFNTEPQNTVGKSTRSLGYSEELIQIWIQKINLSEKENTPVSFQYWREVNGKLYFLSNVVSFSKRINANNILFHYFIEDLTELKRNTESLENEKENLTQDLSILEKKFNFAQNQIIENQNRYQTTFEIANVGIIHISKSGQILMANKTMSKMLGCDPTTISNHNITRFCDNKSVEYFFTAVNAIFNKNITAQNIELKFKKNDNSLFWIEASLSAVVTQNNVDYIVAIIKDINDKNNLEEELLNHRNRQQLMLSSAQISTWDWDLSTGKIINQYNAEKVFGIPHSTRDYFFSRVHPDDLKEISSRINSSLKNKTPFTAYYRYIRPDNNEIRWLESRGNVIINKVLNTETLSGVTFDVTEKKEVDEQLNASRKQFQVLAETLPSFIWKANKTGAILYFNKSWYDYTGADENSSLGWSWIEHIHPDDRELFLRSWQSHLKSGHQDGSLEVRIQNSKQKYRWFLWQTKPVTNSSSKILKWFGSFTDIDAQKKILETTQSNLRTRDEFISIASHELKTPLTALKVHLELIEGLVKKSELSLDRKILKSIETSIKQSNQLSFLIENLLSVSSIKNGLFKLTKEEINIAHLINECIEQYKESLKNAGCHVTSYLNTAVYCKIDIHKIEQVILNLLENIIKYAPNSYVFIELKQIKNSIQIVIQDHGPGISKDKINNIFNRFERGQNKKTISGMGLGLYICKQIVEAHKGRIWAESEPQQGTKIFVELPIS